MSDKATELWDALVAKADNEPDFAKQYVANDDRAFFAERGHRDLLAALEELGHSPDIDGPWLNCGAGGSTAVTAQLRKTCTGCQALARERERLEEAK